MQSISSICRERDGKSMFHSHITDQRQMEQNMRVKVIMDKLYLAHRAMQGSESMTEYSLNLQKVEKEKMPGSSVQQIYII